MDDIYGLCVGGSRLWGVLPCARRALGKGASDRGGRWLRQPLVVSILFKFHMHAEYRLKTLDPKTKSTKTQATRTPNELSDDAMVADSTPQMGGQQAA